MIFTELKFPGAYVIEVERHEDERGYFGRSFCQEEFSARGLSTRVVQCNVSFNHRKGTLRGMHYQLPPMAEAKLVRCTRGAIYDAIVDLRVDSPSYLQWTAVELTEENSRMLYVPEGFAHGFQALADGSEVFYQMFAPYSPEHARGVRWNDPTFGISWPLPDPIVSERDSSFPSLGKTPAR